MAAMAAMAMARGDTAGAEKLIAELDEKFPLATLMQRYWLPTIRAAVALEHKDPNRAVQLPNGKVRRSTLPQQFSYLGIRIGINYVVYAITH